VIHTKALLFIDYQQAEVFKDDILLDKAVCPDTDIYRAFSQVFYNFVLLTVGAETA